MLQILEEYESITMTSRQQSHGPVVIFTAVRHSGEVVEPIAVSQARLKTNGWDLQHFLREKLRYRPGLLEARKARQMRKRAKQEQTK